MTRYFSKTERKELSAQRYEAGKHPSNAHGKRRRSRAEGSHAGWSHELTGAFASGRSWVSGRSRSNEGSSHPGKEEGAQQEAGTTRPNAAPAPSPAPFPEAGPTAGARAVAPRP